MLPSRPLAVLLFAAAAACGPPASDAPTDPSTAGSGDPPSSSSASPGAQGGSSASPGTPAPPSGDASSTAPNVPVLPFPSRLFLLPDRELPVSDLGRAIDTRLAEQPGAVSVIVLVHGRSCGGGGEPQKSLDEAVPELEKTMSAAVVLFHWPGSDEGCPLGFPEARARAAGPALAYLTQVLSAYRAKAGNGLGARKVVLLAHSMGNLVLEAAVGSPSALPPAVFDTVLVGSSATAASGHATWLSRAGIGKATYVSVNGNDNVLLAAGTGRGTRLGRSIGQEPLAPGVLYADFGGANVDHAIYLPSGQKGEGMRGFYRTILRGEPFVVQGARGVLRTEARSGATIAFFDGT